jgi:hypothetical protein
MFESTQKRLVRELLADPELAERVERLIVRRRETGFRVARRQRNPGDVFGA